MVADSNTKVLKISQIFKQFSILTESLQGKYNLEKLQVDFQIYKVNKEPTSHENERKAQIRRATVKKAMITLRTP